MKNMFKNPWAAENSIWFNEEREKWGLENDSESINTRLTSKPTWSQMLTNYPGTSIKTLDLYNAIGGQFPKFKNQIELNSSWLANSCAFRMSRGLNLSGIKLPIKSISTQLVLKGGDGNNYWGRVKELYPIIKSSLGKPLLETSLKKAKLGETKEKMSDLEMNKYYASKGIIMFEVSGWGDASGHFTIWDGNHLIYPGDPLHDDPTSEYYYFHMKYENNGKVFQTDKIILWELN